MSDPLMRRLAELPLAVPDAARADRLRHRCRATLTQSARRAPPLPLTVARRVIAMLWPPVVAGLGVVYLATVILVALAVYSVR
jgi:hypothetical protein